MAAPSSLVAVLASASIACAILLLKRRKRPLARMLQSTVPDCPFALLHAWLSEAEEELGLYARAMVLATYSPDDGPTARTVLMQRCEAAGVIQFGTTQGSQKMRNLREEPRCELVFRWGDRQVRIRGLARIEGDAVSKAAFQTLDRGAQLSLHVLNQGRLIDEETHTKAAAEVARLSTELSERPVSRPSSYTAVSIVPTSFEFYQGGGGELGYVQHDRFLYVADCGGNKLRSDQQVFRLVGRLQA